MERDNKAHVHSAVFLNNKEVRDNGKYGHRRESRDNHSEQSKGDRERHVSYGISFRCNLKQIQMKFSPKGIQPHRFRKETSGHQEN